MNLNYIPIAYLTCSIITCIVFWAIAERKTYIELLLVWLIAPIALPFLLIQELPDFIDRKRYNPKDYL